MTRAPMAHFSGNGHTHELEPRGTQESNDEPFAAFGNSATMTDDEYGTLHDRITLAMQHGGRCAGTGRMRRVAEAAAHRMALA